MGSAPACGGSPTGASTPAAGGTALKRMTIGQTTGGSPATNSNPGKNATEVTTIATVTGTGKIAPACGGSPTTALKTAAGGTAHPRMTIGQTTGGSPATNSLPGITAENEVTRSRMTLDLGRINLQAVQAAVAVGNVALAT